MSSPFLNLSIVDPQGFRVGRERAEQERGEQERGDRELLFRRLKPVEDGYQLALRCMDGTRQSLLNKIMDWVANTSESGQQGGLQIARSGSTAHLESGKLR